ncbi:TolB family protein, partial [Tahibacter aquaticus]
MSFPDFNEASMSVFRCVHQRCAHAARFVLMLLALPGAATAAQSIELVSQAAFPANTNGDLASIGPLDLSDDSRFVLFASDASNLVLNDNNDRADLFLLDTQTGEVERIATDVSSAAAPYYYGDASLSNDARYVLYNHRSDAGNVYQVYRFDRLTRTTLLISADADGVAGSDSSVAGGLSADGRYAVFTSNAGLLPNVQTPSVYRYDALTARLQIVPAASDSGVAVDITPDGRYVLYESGTGRLVVRDMDSATSTPVNVTADGVVLWLQNLPDPYKSSCSNRRISDDGRYVVFVTGSDADPSDTDSAYDVYRYDRLSNTRELISTTVAGVAPDGVNVCPGISADGQRIAFFSTVHMDAYKLMLRDMTAGTLRVMVGYISDRDVGGLSLGDEPDALFFHTSGLVSSAGQQVYRYRDDGAPVVLSRAYAAGSEFADGHSGDSAVNPSSYDLGPGISADGRFVVFSSNAKNLVSGFPYACHLFLRDRTAGTTAQVYWADGGSSLSECANPSITPDSRYVVFSANRELGPVPFRLQREIFRYDRTSGQTSLVSTDTSGTAADASSSGPHMS